MKDKIINQIIHELIPLRTLYSEIDIITNDLLNNKLDTLKEFLDKNYQDTNINPDLKNLVISLVRNGKLNDSYLKNLDIENPKLTEIDLISFLNCKLIGYKAINIKQDSFTKLKYNIENGYNTTSITILTNAHDKLPIYNEEVIDQKQINNDLRVKLTPIEADLDVNSTSNELNSPKLIPINEYEFPSDIENNVSEHPKLTPIDEYEFPSNIENNVSEHPKLTPIDEVNNQTNNLSNDGDLESLEETYIEKLRKSIMEAQLNYLNNANSFIEELENKSESEIYQKLLSLNDIRYIHHSISKLSSDTLNRLLPYVSELLNSNTHNSINIFIEESIKKSLHEKKKM